MGFTVKDNYYWQKVRTHQLVTVLTEPQNMLICHTIFHYELFLWLRPIFLAECEIFNFAVVGGLKLEAVKSGLAFGLPSRAVISGDDNSYGDEAIVNNRCYSSSSSNLFMYIIASLSFSVITLALHYIPLTSASLSVSTGWVYSALLVSISHCMSMRLSLCLSHIILGLFFYPVLFFLRPSERQVFIIVMKRSHFHELLSPCSVLPLDVSPVHAWLSGWRSTWSVRSQVGRFGRRFQSSESPRIDVGYVFTLMWFFFQLKMPMLRLIGEGYVANWGGGMSACWTYAVRETGYLFANWITCSQVN